MSIIFCLLRNSGMPNLVTRRDDTPPRRNFPCHKSLSLPAMLDGGRSGPRSVSRMNAAPPPSPHLSAADGRDFKRVDTWMFDLDNTLYPHESISGRRWTSASRAFIADLFASTACRGAALQKYYYHRYGTTLRGMMDETASIPTTSSISPTTSTIRGSPNPVLGAAIEQLPGRKLILTNGSRKHAETVMRRLGIYDHFEDVFDIVAADFDPEARPPRLRALLRQARRRSPKAAMFEDLARNLVVPHDLGMTTTLVIPRTIDPFRETFEQEAVEAPHIDHITNDLAGFLTERVGS